VLGSEWLPVALGSLIAASVLAVWIQRDGFIDREEANHVQRALETYDAMFGSASEPPSLRRLVAVRIDQSKVWYGWPSYVPEAIAWRVLGRTYDNGVLANICCLLAIVALSGAIGWWFDPRAAPLAALFHAMLPGALVWAHFFNVTLAVMALTYLAVLALLRASAWERRAQAVVAGLVCAAVTVAKATTVFFWAPLLAVTAARALIPRDRRAVAARNLSLFVLATLPAAAHYALGWEPLRWWAARVHQIYAFESGWASFRRGAWMRPLEVLLPFHLALCVLGFMAMLARRDRRWLGLALALWPVPSLLGVFLTGGFPGTTRDVLPLVLAPCLIASLALARRAPLERLSVLWSLLAFGGLFVSINFSSRFDDTAMGRHLTWLRPYIDGTPTIRLRPYPPVLDSVILALRASGAGGACSCLPAAPYPLPPGDPRPVVLLDHNMIGPENLTVAFALGGEKLPWNLGYVPYPLPTPLLRTALGCAQAIVVGGPTFTAEYYGADQRARIGREMVLHWGRAMPVGQWPGFGQLTLRQSTERPLCEMGEQRDVEEWLARWPVGGGEGSYYGDYLRLLLAGGDPPVLGSMMATIREAAGRRLRRLEENHDTVATMFGEEGVARGVLASLQQMRVLDAARADPSAWSALLWLRRGSALPLKLSPPKLGAGGFAFQWDAAGFPSRVRPGRPLIGYVSVVNRGAEIWPSRREARGEAYAVRVGCRILDEGGTEVRPAVARGDLPGSVSPGERATLWMHIDAPTAPGAYRLECDLLQELHEWFSAHGNAKLTAGFMVEPDGAPAN